MEGQSQSSLNMEGQNQSSLMNIGYNHSVRSLSKKRTSIITTMTFLPTVGESDIEAVATVVLNLDSVYGCRGNLPQLPINFFEGQQFNSLTTE